MRTVVTSDISQEDLDQLIFSAAESEKGTASYFGEATFSIENLISFGACVDAVNKIGETPLMRAASWGSLENVEILIAAGADVNAENEFGQTPLYYSLRGFNPLAAVKLIRAGAEVDLENAEIRHCLARKKMLYGSFETVDEISKFRDLTNDHNRLILSIAAATLDVEARDSFGNTLLIALAAIGDVDNIFVLRKRGAAFNASNDRGETALFLAEKGGHEKTVEELLKFGAENLRPSPEFEIKNAAQTAVVQNGCVVA